jgi:Fic family protein
MKIPLKPPSFEELIRKIRGAKGNPERIFEVLKRGGGTMHRGEYIHWDKMRHLEPPEGLSVEEWWLAVKTARQSLYRTLPFTDAHNHPFRFAMADPVLRLLHQVDRDVGGQIQAPEIIVNPQTRDTYLISSLIEEAITSSQLEGAATTRKVAKEMLREGRKPRTRGEQMIFNNYHAMQFIRTITGEKLTPAIVLELQRILTKNTLNDPKAVGRFRREEDDIHVVDTRDSVVLHTPPNASELEKRADRLCRFANEMDGDTFIHPVVRAIILHFAIGYDHPFADGNGRTARAVFYWSMLSRGYWLTEYISISRILKGAPSEYARAYLYTETDENDVTYFIIHQLNVILRAIQDLQKYLAKKSTEVHEVEAMIRQSPRLRGLLNHRQIALLGHALRHPGTVYRIEGHRQSHKVTYDTARTDLLKLARLKLLEKQRTGRAFVFLSPPNLAARLRQANTK